MAAGWACPVVAAIAERIESPLTLRSSRAGASSGFQASITLPTEVPNIFSTGAAR
jgi:two-component system OmpR family sensor kinase